MPFKKDSKFKNQLGNLIEGPDRERHNSSGRALYDLKHTF